MQGIIYSVIVTAFLLDQIVSYDVMCCVEGRTRLYRIREDELTKIKKTITGYVSFEKDND